MNFLPPADEQAWLLEKMRELIRHRGKRTFLNAPLLEPTEEFFPDRWTPNAAGVRRLAKRVLRYAGMGSFPVEVTLSMEDAMPIFDSQGHVRGHEHVGDVAAWFDGLDDGVCHFGVATDRIEDPRSLAAILCHEVSHAYRERHGLQYETHDEEESLTDLTTVYLGFGILSANLASWRTSKGHPEYMTQQGLSFLLAAQVVCRGLDAAERKRVTKHLDTNQAAFFEASCEELERREVWALLGVAKGSRSAARAETARSFNRGLPVYRVRGGWFRRARCSDPACGARLTREDEVCPGCMGSILADVASMAEAARLEKSFVESHTADGVLAELKRDTRD